VKPQGCLASLRVKIWDNAIRVRFEEPLHAVVEDAEVFIRTAELPRDLV
jgi:hypothetical protein